MCLFFFFKQKTAYEMRISDWSSDVCSSDLPTDMVRVNYKGSLLDGKVFDDSSTHGGPAEIPLQQVVPGWQEGIALMPVGSKYNFWIPAKQIGRASWRERVCQYGKISVVDGTLNKKTTEKHGQHDMSN